MTHPDDLDGVSEHPLPEELVERLLTGASPGAGVDEPTVAVAQVLQAARQAPSATEWAEADAAAAAFAARMAGVMPTTVISLDTHRRRRAGRVSARVAAGVAALTLFSAGAAAAATGHLPDPVQRTVAQAVSHVGVDLPSPDDRSDEVADGTDDATSTSSAVGSSSSSSATTAASTSSAASTSTATTPSSATTDDRRDGPDSTATEGSTVVTSVGPDVTGEAKKGLCNAWEKQRKNGAEPNGVAFENLRKAADAAGQSVDEFCADDEAPATSDATAPGSSRPSTATTEPGSEPEGSTSVPKPKGPPATYKGPDEPVPPSTDRTLPPNANGTLPSATSVKPGNGGGNK